MNIQVLRALGGFGGGGDFIKSLSPIFYIKDLTVIQGGYFVDSSGNNKQIQAATTTITNDSLIMPANDVEIIAALTSAGCYSQFYTNDATPKTVLLSNVSPCYNDYSYYGYIDKKYFCLFSSAQTTNRSKILNKLDLHIVYFNSVQTATPAQVSITYRCAVNKSAYVDYGNWGNQAIQKVNATNVDHTLSSTGYQANTTYNIQMFTKKSDNGWIKFHCSSNSTVSDINSLSFIGMPLTYWALTNSGTNHIIDSSHFIGMPITYWQLYNSGTNNIINSLHFVGMPITTWILYNSGTNHTINSSHFVGMSLTYWNLTNSGTNNIINSLHFVGMPITTWQLNNSGTNHIIDSSHFIGMPITYWQLNSSGTNHAGTIGDLYTNITAIHLENSGQGIGITSSLKEWAGATITLQSGYSEANVRNFIINWSAVAGTGIKTINLRGTNAAIHINAVDDPTLYNAAQQLISKGKTLLYNTY